MVPVDLARSVKQILEEQGALAQAKDLDLGFERLAEDALVMASPSLVHELVANLVDNALRYTPAKGVVTVTLSRSPEGVVLRVEDNGPGIPQADRARVFERFCRLHDDEIPGCGLGLSIAQEVSQVLGAGLEFSDPPAGTGLVVTLTFPSLA